MSHFFRLFFLLCVGHAVCDYPLQGDFLARGKNHKNPLPGIPWYQCLFAHALIHAGAVYLVTGSLILAIGELVCHIAMDWTKCEGGVSFDLDQGFHYFCKLLWALAVVGVL